MQIDSEHRQQLTPAERDLAELRRFCSHALREPIHTIGIGLDLLEADDIAGEQREIIDAQVRQSVAGLDAVAARLTEYLRLETVSLTDVDLGDAAAASARTVAGRYPTVSLGVDAPHEVIRADPMLLCTLFTELLDNAARHGRDGAVHELSIELERAPGHTRLRLHQPGAPAWMHDPAVLELFKHGPDGGPGVGLSICRRVAELHGGTLRLAPEAPRPHVEIELAV